MNMKDIFTGVLLNRVGSTLKEQTLSDVVVEVIADCGLVSRNKRTEKLEASDLMSVLELGSANADMSYADNNIVIVYICNNKGKVLDIEVAIQPDLYVTVEVLSDKKHSRIVLRKGKRNRKHKEYKVLFI